MDCVLVQNNKAHEIWRNTTKTALAGKFSVELLAEIVETTGAVDVGFTWDGATFKGQRWVIVTATGEFVSGGYFDPWLPDAAHSIVNTGSRTPQPHERWSGTAVVAKTEAELSQDESRHRLKRVEQLSKSADVMTLCGMLARSRDVVAWEKLPLPKKLAAIADESKAWTAMRQLVDSNIKE